MRALGPGWVGNCPLRFFCKYATKPREKYAMQDRKFHVVIARFPYGGNGGTSSEVPDIANWLLSVADYAFSEPRILKLSNLVISDTPITMTRNLAVQRARELGADALVMVDSDMKPDLYSGAPRFFPSTFDLFCKHYEQGPIVVGAPYCGPPPQECVYVFQWCQPESAADTAPFSLEMVSREEAASRSGFQEAAALPTGLIFYDMRIFDVVRPPYFSYEWKDEYQAEKASTEDVMATRDMSLRGIELLGYNPVLCNWDSWAGHWKPKCVGKPISIRACDIAEKYRKGLSNTVSRNESLVEVGTGTNLQGHAPHVVLQSLRITPPSGSPDGREQSNTNREETGPQEVNQAWPKSHTPL
jgi:hypothetical protein